MQAGNIIEQDNTPASVTEGHRLRQPINQQTKGNNMTTYKVSAPFWDMDVRDFNSPEAQAKYSALHSDIARHNEQAATLEKMTADPLAFLTADGAFSLVQNIHKTRCDLATAAVFLIERRNALRAELSNEHEIVQRRLQDELSRLATAETEKMRADFPKWQTDAKHLDMVNQGVFIRTKTQRIQAERWPEYRGNAMQDGIDLQIARKVLVETILK
jgi:hypothetical protein